METEFIRVPLDKLRVADFNARQTAAPVDGLVASILCDGLITPLAVAGPNADGVYDVIDGGRRLAALQRLAEAGDLDNAIGGGGVPAILHADSDAGNQRSRALAANVMREPLHPVDAFEAFDALTRDGFSVETIAESYGLCVATRWRRRRTARHRSDAPETATRSRAQVSTCRHGNAELGASDSRCRAFL